MNERRQADLVAQVEHAGWAYLPATGSSPDGSWSEPGIALAGVTEEQALSLGRRHSLQRGEPRNLKGMSARARIVR